MANSVLDHDGFRGARIWRRDGKRLSGNSRRSAAVDVCLSPERRRRIADGGQNTFLRLHWRRGSKDRRQSENLRSHHSAVDRHKSSDRRPRSREYQNPSVACARSVRRSLSGLPPSGISGRTEILRTGYAASAPVGGRLGIKRGPCDRCPRVKYCFTAQGCGSEPRYQFANIFDQSQ